jgi:hypothetical protein
MMLGQKPAGLNPLSDKVLDILSKCTVFAWPALENVCARAKLDPRTLTVPQLKSIVDELAGAVGRFGNEEKRRRVREGLLSLVS